MTQIDLVLVGAGGHAKVVIDIVRALSGYTLIGLLDPGAANRSVSDVPVLGGDDHARQLRAEGCRHGLVAVGRNDLRVRLGLELMDIEFELLTVIHPSAVVSSAAELGQEGVVMANAVINSHARIGAHCIINTGAIVEDDCVVGDGAHIAPRSVMGGCCAIGSEVLFGIGAVARPGCRVGNRAVVGAGAVVISDIPPDLVVIGIPAR